MPKLFNSQTSKVRCSEEWYLFNDFLRLMHRFIQSFQMSCAVDQGGQRLHEPALKAAIRNGAHIASASVVCGVDCCFFRRRSQAFSWKKKAKACTVGSSKLSVSEAIRLPVTA